MPLEVADAEGRRQHGDAPCCDGPRPAQHAARCAVAHRVHKAGTRGRRSGSRYGRGRSARSIHAYVVLVNHLQTHGLLGSTVIGATACMATAVGITGSVLCACDRPPFSLNAHFPWRAASWRLRCPVARSSQGCCHKPCTAESRYSHARDYSGVRHADRVLLAAAS